MPNRICLNTSTILPLPLLDKIRLTAETGYDGIELWTRDILEHISQGGEVRDVEKAIGDNGLIVPCWISIRRWAEADDDEYPAVIEEARRQMELAARFHSPFIIASPPRRPCPVERIISRYRQLLELGRQVGIRPTFEYVSCFRGVPSPALAWRILQQIDDVDATMVIDAFHNWNSGATCADLEAIPVARISHYHIDDACRGKPAGTQTDADRVLPGDGVIDLHEEIRLLRKKGYEGAISLELFNRELWERDPREVLGIGLERIRELLT
ncbi:MAG: hypothetical protein KatS3mg105_4006 [Gemmatales bacterium]|nr:MAG: hypothetical protein KatS3mg105_4006 [Gemmatales bacterium]